MIPFLETGVTLMATKGFDLVASGASKARSRALDVLPATPRDKAIDAALATAAIVPSLVNVFGVSPLVERFHSPSVKTLYRLYKARPYLDALSVAAVGVLALRSRTSRSDGLWLSRASRMVGALRFSAQFISPPTAFSPLNEGHLVVTARELAQLIEPDEPVLGLVLNGEARCYPLSIMRKPHFLHDTLGGIPVAPTYCERSNAAVAFRDEWQGARLDLNVAGYSNNNIVFYEGKSDGMIQQLEGRIGAGPNEGDPLQVFPLAHTTWAQWRELHPETTGLWYDQGVKESAIKTLMQFTDKLNTNMQEPVFAMDGAIDTRLEPKTPVLGVSIRGESRAYDREFLRAHPVLNDEIGGEPVVVLYDERRDIASCYSRRLDDRVLTFAEASHEKAIAEDRETGRLWDVSGAARDREGKSLRPVSVCVDRIRWFVWAHFHPHTRLPHEDRSAVAAD